MDLTYFVMKSNQIVLRFVRLKIHIGRSHKKYWSFLFLTAVWLASLSSLPTSYLRTSGRRQIGDGMKADSIYHGSSYNFPVFLTFSSPESLNSTSMYVVGSLPLAVRLCVGIQVFCWCAGELVSRNTCPASAIILFLIVVVTLSSFPYSSLFVILLFQEIFFTILSILVYVPSMLFSSAFLYRPSCASIEKDNFCSCSE